MNRRVFLASLTTLPFAAASYSVTFATTEPDFQTALNKNIEKITLSDSEWKQKLTEQQYAVLRKASTEPSGSSPLDHEERTGTFICAGCDLPLFSSEAKYDSGTGWPSFYESIAHNVETKLDFKLIYPRTEYHCVRCGGHQGHLFKDGPEPTGKRYCNNGVALKFIPSS